MAHSIAQSIRLPKKLGVVARFVLLVTVSLAFPAFAASSGTWTATGTLNFPRVGHTATLRANGQVLVAGGEDSSGNLIATAELYNLAAGKWTVTGSMVTARIDHTATLLANGEVLIARGVSGTYTAAAELYNPSTGQWTSTGSMTMPRAFPGAALLTNGEVLVAGGSNLEGTSNATAELYNPGTGKWSATTSMPSGGRLARADNLHPVEVNDGIAKCSPPPRLHAASVRPGTWKIVMRMSNLLATQQQPVFGLRRTG